MTTASDVSIANDQISLFETVYEEVKTGEEEGLHLLTKIGNHLKPAFDAAEADGNTELMQSINDAWERTQNIMAIVSRQSIALRGGSETFKMLKAQRDQVTHELERILRGLFNGDKDVHPAIQAFARDMQNWETEYLHELEEEAMEEMFRQLVTRMFEKYTLHHYQEQLDCAADGLFDLIIEETIPTDEQKALLQQLAETFYPND